MPRGSAPSEVMKARYSLLNKQLDQAERDADKGLFKRVKRGFQSLLKSEYDIKDARELEKSGQRVMSEKHFKIARRVAKIEKNMLRQDRMAEKVKKDQQP